MNFRIDIGERRRAYTLVEALVASSLLLIGVSAAASMSLTLLTQEEINERSVKVFNYLDNAARLYQLGVPASEIEGILPAEAGVQSLTTDTATTTVPQLGPIEVATMTITYLASEALDKNQASELEWTGGDSETPRSESVSLIKADSYIPPDLPRVQHFGP